MLQGSVRDTRPVRPEETRISHGTRDGSDPETGPTRGNRSGTKGGEKDDREPDHLSMGRKHKTDFVV